MKSIPLKICIIGAGFSGVALAVALHRFSQRPLHIFLCDKTGQFGKGDAYGTPFPFHLLNVRAHDMSVFEDLPEDFVEWLETHHAQHPYIEKDKPIAEQFVPRCLYGEYLQDRLNHIQSDMQQKNTLTLIPQEVVDVQETLSGAKVVLGDTTEIEVEKVVLATGNNPPTAFPFSVSGVHAIPNSWHYRSLTEIPRDAPVLIMGTGLSMIDAVLTLYHQHHHQGNIFALSRHGLLPLPHTDQKEAFHFQKPTDVTLRQMMKYIRLLSHAHIKSGGRWQSIMNAIRSDIPSVWESMPLNEKKRFIRHLLPYWNIHRHRVHQKLAKLLENLQETQQLHILSGRVLSVVDGKVNMRLRHSDKIEQLEIKSLINCMGPGLALGGEQPIVRALIQRQLAMLDPLGLGFAIAPTGAIKSPSGSISNTIYTLGSLRKGTIWECTAVPEIRKQSFDLSHHLLRNSYGIEG